MIDLTVCNCCGAQFVTKYSVYIFVQIVIVLVYGFK